MRVRTPEEIKTYAEGYNACYEDFRRELKKHKTLSEALTKMEIIKSAVDEVAQRKEQRMANYEDAVRFNFSCPYTGKHCDKWNCKSCSVNIYEEGWVKGKQEEESEDAKWQKRIKEIKADILRYKSDCEMAEDAVECKMCNKTMFDSILRIIDKHTKGDT